MTPRPLRNLLALAIVNLALACDRSASDQSASYKPTLPPPKPDSADITAIAPLIPNRPTHLTVSPQGNLYYVQELPLDQRSSATMSSVGEAGGDMMFVAGEGDLPRATPLSSANVLAAMRINSGGGSAAGNIRSIAAADDGRIYFYFAGGLKKQSIHSLGQFNPADGAIRILADTRQLATDSQMGDSLALARATVISAGRSVWLWLRHPDAAAVFHFDPQSIPARGPIVLSRPFIHLTAARKSDGDPLDLTRDEDYEISPGSTPETLLLTDLWTGALWQVNERGEASVLQSLIGLPRRLSIPGVLGENLSPANVRLTGIRPGSAIIFAADSDAITPHVASRVDPVELQTVYPSLLILPPPSGDAPATPATAAPAPNRFIAIPRDQLHGPQALAVYAMQLQQLVYEPARGTWLGYDSPSGQLVRISVSAK